MTMGNKEVQVCPTFRYRDRIYQYYVHARQQSLTPESVKDFKPRAAYLNRLIHHHFPLDKNAAMLDLGCGHGALLYYARKAGYHNITGVDRSPQQVAEAKRFGIDGVREGDLQQLLESLPDEALDVVIAFDVIEHFTKDELLPFVDEVYRILRKDGKWILHTANGESPFSGRSRYMDFTHELVFTRESITQLLKASRFRNVFCQEDTPAVHGFKSAIRWVLWKFIRGTMRVYMAIETGAGERACIFSQNFLTVAVK
jgi:cyclopropane fatty-acyl-phospholipid synthase-like methyltransferase